MKKNSFPFTFFVAAVAGFVSVFAIEMVTDYKASALWRAAPFQDPNARYALRSYAEAQSSKAFAASVTRSYWGWSSERADQTDANRAAMHSCESYGDTCLLYAVDDTVVWDPAEADATWERIVSSRATSGTIWRYHNEENQHGVPVIMPPGAPSIISDYLSAYGVLGSLRRRYDGAPPRHGGFDIIGAIGTPVLAAADGIVFVADFDEVAGNRVRIAHVGPDHGVRLITVYIHLDQVLVETGEEVLRGQQIGTVGATGTGAPPERPHLHFATQGTNPHLHWHDGPGRVTCYSRNRVYAGDRAALTYPLPCGGSLDAENLSPSHAGASALTGQPTGQ